MKIARIDLEEMTSPRPISGPNNPPLISDGRSCRRATTKQRPLALTHKYVDGTMVVNANLDDLEAGYRAHTGLCKSLGLQRTPWTLPPTNKAIYTLETPNLIIEGLFSPLYYKPDSRQSITGLRQTPWKSTGFQSTVSNAIQRGDSSPCREYLLGKRLPWHRSFSNCHSGTLSPHTEER